MRNTKSMVIFNFWIVAQFIVSSPNVEKLLSFRIEKNNSQSSNNNKSTYENKSLTLRFFVTLGVRQWVWWIFNFSQLVPLFCSFEHWSIKLKKALGMRSLWLLSICWTNVAVWWFDDTNPRWTVAFACKVIYYIKILR